MSPTLQESDPSSDDEPRPGLWQRWYWPTVTLVAWLAFELTASPAISVVLLCAHFGTQDVLTGLWLWRRDPHRGRGRACAWFSLARGVTLTWLASLLLRAVVLWVAILFPGQGGPIPNVKGLMSIGLMISGGAPLAALLGLLALLSAWRHHVKVWLDPSLHRARQSGKWPPRPSGLKNTASEALGMMYVAVGFVLLLPGLFLAGRFPGLLKWLPLVLLPFGLLIWGFVVWTKTRCADRPSECWGDETSDVSLTVQQDRLG